MASYSIAAVGIPADNAQAPSSVILDDQYVQRTGDIKQAMSQNTQILCKNPDGGQSWYTIDAERSRPGGPRFMLKVGP